MTDESVPHNVVNLYQQMATLVESIKSLSTITANHDIIITRLIDDHESRIRLLEKCSLASNKVDQMEIRIRELENWRWYVVGIAVGLSIVAVYLTNKILG